MIFGYARVSTQNQVQEGESLATQKTQIQSYAISKGFSIAEENIFIEGGVSGGIEFSKRPQGNKLTETVSKGDIIIFTKLDRAFRNTRNALNVLHEMKEKGVSVHFIDLGGDVTGNGIGAIMFTILSAFATFEKERIATRIREVKQSKKEQGLFTGGKAGFGYQVVDGKKAKKPDEQKIISEMKRLKSRGKSYRYIAKWLNERKGINLSFMSVRTIIS
jgi:putative DNA-invertase from lambdoid prophage Rac